MKDLDGKFFLVRGNIGGQTSSMGNIGGQTSSMEGNVTLGTDLDEEKLKFKNLKNSHLILYHLKF